jgi:CBS domain-containing protein
MKVRDVMTQQVVSCRKDADIGTAARLMLEGRFGSLPVVDVRGRVVGMITDRDIAMAAATRQRNASHIGVHEAMSEKVRSCFAEEDLGVALKRMQEGQVRRLPVLDGTSHLVGILSIDDVALRAIYCTNGLSATEFVKALRSICSQKSVEPEFVMSDVFVNG